MARNDYAPALGQGYLHVQQEEAVMSCNCGGGKKTKYEYTSPDGRKQIVQSQTEALTLVRLNGGSWRIVTS